MSLLPLSRLSITPLVQLFPSVPTLRHSARHSWERRAQGTLQALTLSVMNTTFATDNRRANTSGRNHVHPISA